MAGTTRSTRKRATPKVVPPKPASEIITERAIEKAKAHLGNGGGVDEAVAVLEAGALLAEDFQHE